MRQQRNVYVEYLSIFPPSRDNGFFISVLDHPTPKLDGGVEMIEIEGLNPALALRLSSIWQSLEQPTLFL
jgi:hypothetical protein